MEQQQNGSNVFMSDEFTHKDRASTAMIFGIVSLVTSFLPILSIAGIVFGALALKKSSDNKRFALEKGLQENGMNSAGYICGLIGTILASILTVIYLLAVIAIVIFATGIATSAASSIIPQMF